MPRFFVDALDDIMRLTGESAVHISRSLRMRAGDELTLCDGLGTDAQAVINEITPDSVTLEIISRTPSKSEPSVSVTLFQALPKSDKLEFIIQKATELGAVAIQPFLSRYCVSRPKDFSKKLDRLSKIASEAAKQSGRGRIPEVLDLIDISGIVASGFDLTIFCYEKATRPLSDALRDISSVKSVAVIIGSEGGFSDDEAAVLENAGALPCSLGNRILRCETAPIAALSAIMFASGNM